MTYPILKPEDLKFIEERWTEALYNLEDARLRYHHLSLPLEDALESEQRYIAHGVVQSAEEILHIAKRIIKEGGWPSSGTDQKSIFNNLRDNGVITPKTSDGMKEAMYQRGHCVHDYKILDFTELETYLEHDSLVIHKYLDEIKKYLDWQKANQ